jgi:uncharacterized protein
MLGERIAEHAVRHCLPRISVTLHGGEPLLVGLTGLRAVVGTLRSAVRSRTDLDIGLQTNGVLLDEQIASFLLDERIQVGISLDGGRKAHDRHRRFANGAGSYDRAAAAVALMTSPGLREVFAGLLATVDPANDPVQLFHDLTALMPGKIDLLLPHATWEIPPKAALPDRTVYGNWLSAFFDAWYDAPPIIGVRLFQEMMHALLGGASTSEAVGLSAPQSIVVETDGTIELSDILKVTYPGAPVTGLNIFDQSLEDVLSHPRVVAVAQGISGLSPACQTCPVLPACGGGQYPHRYRAGNGFANPSVYCRDLGSLINHVQERIQADMTRLDLHSACRGILNETLPVPRSVRYGRL